jgi:hypothetical protein
MSPLRTFMLNLLSSHNGDVQLVVDNAALTTERVPPSRPNLAALVTMSASNHSCSRWETDEPSPGRASDQGAKTLGSIALSHQGRPPPLFYKNSSPACPIRKLSPRVHANENHEHTTPPSLCPRMEGKLLIKNFDRLAISRPPLSPRKNSGRSILTPGGNKAPAPKKKLSHTKPLRPPVRVISKLSRPLAELQSPAGSIVPPPAVWTAVSEVGASSGKSAGGLTRGLSKTLGIDIKEQAPICPTRRPSTQSHEPAAGDHASGAATGTGVPKHSSSSSAVFTIDILVLPPPPDLVDDDIEKKPGDDLLHSKDRHPDSKVRGTGGCSPIFLQRFSKRR